MYVSETQVRLELAKALVMAGTPLADIPAKVDELAGVVICSQVATPAPPLLTTGQQVDAMIADSITSADRPA